MFYLQNQIETRMRQFRSYGNPEKKTCLRSSLFCLSNIHYSSSKPQNINEFACRFSRRLVSLSRWECSLHGTNGPFNFQGVSPWWTTSPFPRFRQYRSPQGNPQGKRRNICSSRIGKRGDERNFPRKERSVAWGQTRGQTRAERKRTDLSLIIS